MRIEALVASAVVAAGACGLASAAPGDLNPLFGTGGKVVTTFPSTTESRARAVAVQPDGKIVAAGWARVASGPIVAIARYLPDGSLDPTFAGTGRLLSSAGSFTAAAHALALQPDGKIVIAGEATPGTLPNCLVARFNSDGTPDAAFGVGGVVTTPLCNTATSIALQPDGRIVIAGREGMAVRSIVTARLLPNGSVDTSFSGDGRALGTTTTYQEVLGTGVAVAPDGKVVTVGYIFTIGLGLNQAVAVTLRYLPGGEVDATFSDDGGVATQVHVTTSPPYGPQDYATAVAVRADSRILVAGRGADYGGTSEFVLIGHNVDGSPDTSLGGGAVATAVGASAARANAIALQSNGKIVLAGAAGEELAIVRYAANASLDTSFGLGGKVTVPFGVAAGANAVALTPSGAIVAAGEANAGEALSFALVQLEGDVAPAAARLVNLSTRGRVLTGEDVMIGGFIIEGTGSQTVAIVATGPSLVSYGIASPLANPRITLVRSSDQVIVAANDDWQTDANAALLAAADFAPSNPLEAALYITLPSGAYTAIVQGADGGTGVAVLGVYKVN
jgi:uncharacterized delta-60 repeat protein